MASKKRLSEGIAEDITGVSIDRIALKRVTAKKLKEKKYLEARNRVRFTDEISDSTFGQRVPGSYNPYHSGIGAMSVKGAHDLGADVDPNELAELHEASLERIRRKERGYYGKKKPSKKPIRKPAHKTTKKRSVR